MCIGSFKKFALKTQKLNNKLKIIGVLQLKQLAYKASAGSRKSGNLLTAINQ